MIDARKAAREGKRYHAFYVGHRDARAGQDANPYPPDSEDAICWANGFRYGEDQP